ncbi:MAG: imidazole glycerol phosphate synthase subunit HisH [Terrimicrobiaceae bacterium]|nr:imidazole glycerol phosphate synthase subunit HisH [Terrimicrobiaceae bacterium]
MRIEAAVVDYGSGNLRSVVKALEACGAKARLVESARQLGEPAALVVPGVGAFGDCAASLDRAGLREPLIEWIAAGRPYLGICLGYQLLFEGSEESPGARGLGILPGVVRRFPASAGKIPHMGWNQVEGIRGPLFASAPPRPWFYFVHSYYPDLAEPAAASSWCEYGIRFAASVSRGSLHATQFHPEKSQAGGLALLQDFLAATASLGAHSAS